MSRVRDYISRQNRRRQWIKEQRQWDAHGQPGLQAWIENKQRRRPSRQADNAYLLAEQIRQVPPFIRAGLLLKGEVQTRYFQSVLSAHSLTQ